MKAPFRTLTVCSGQYQAIGLIKQHGVQRFTALLSSTGETFGPFRSKADAAQALDDAHRQTGDNH